MPTDWPARPYPLPGIAMECWLVRFDKTGACTAPATRAALLDRLEARPAAPVILFSHGWNNDFGDATQLYAAFAKCLEAGGALDPAPIFVGILWPSAWLPNDDGPRFAGTPLVADTTVMGDTRERLIGDIADTLTSAADRARLDALTARDRLSRIEALDLARLLQPLVRGTQARAPDGTDPTHPAADEGVDERTATTDTILRALEALERGDADDGPPGGIDDVGIVGAGAADPATAGLLDRFDPLQALRLASLYQMKDRAGAVGFHGVGPLLRDILARTPAPVYGVGHSFGAKVVLSALVSAEPPRPVAGLLLLQPAISHLSFADTVPGREGPGGYRAVLPRVSGRILLTFSKLDVPLHTIFHLALIRSADLGEAQVAARRTEAGDPPNVSAALGGYGPRGSGEVLLEPLPEPGTPLAVGAEARLVGLDGSLGERIKGHGDVATPDTAWLFRLLMASGGA